MESNALQCNVVRCVENGSRVGCVYVGVRDVCSESVRVGNGVLNANASKTTRLPTEDLGNQNRQTTRYIYAGAACEW